MSRDFCLPGVMYFADISIPADSPNQEVKRALGGVLAAAQAGRLRAPGPKLGLSHSSFEHMLAHLLPDLEIHVDEADGCDPILADEFSDLVALLLAHRSHDGPEVEWLAHAIACGCMGGDHLYQDMGLPDRQALSELLREHFTALFEKNIGNMKWKKFFYKQLCDQAEVRACRSPSCQVCGDFWNCFGPEDDSTSAAPVRNILPE